MILPIGGPYSNIWLCRGIYGQKMVVSFHTFFDNVKTEKKFDCYFTPNFLYLLSLPNRIRAAGIFEA